MKKDGGYAFPQQTISLYHTTKDGIEPVYETIGGMTQRDYIATRNMPELLKMSWDIFKDCFGDKPEEESFIEEDFWISMAAELSYKAADALLAKREKEQ